MIAGFLGRCGPISSPGPARLRYTRSLFAEETGGSEHPVTLQGRRSRCVIVSGLAHAAKIHGRGKIL